MKITLLLVILTQISYAQEYYVIISSQQKQKITKKLLKQVYLGKLDKWDNGQRITPIFDSSFFNERTMIFSNLFQKNKRQFSRFWHIKLFSGRGTPPKRVNDIEHIMDSILKNPSGIAITKKRPRNLPKGLKLTDSNKIP